MSLFGNWPVYNIEEHPAYMAPGPACFCGIGDGPACPLNLYILLYTMPPPPIPAQKIAAINEDRSGLVYRLCIAMMVLPTVAVVIRTWSRAISKSPRRSRFWWDDWLCIAILVR